MICKRVKVVWGKETILLVPWRQGLGIQQGMSVWVCSPKSLKYCSRKNMSSLLSNVIKLLKKARGSQYPRHNIINKDIGLCIYPPTFLVLPPFQNKSYVWT